MSGMLERLFNISNSAGDDLHREINLRRAWNKSMWKNIRQCSPQARSFIQHRHSFNKNVVDEIKILLNDPFL